MANKQTKSSFYQRSLPTSCIAFSSERGKELLIECLEKNPSYFPLSEQFHTQTEPAYCGLSTLVMVLNALHIDPKRHWKGPWRWFHEDMLDCCVENEIVKQKGITLDEFVCLAACNGSIPQIYRILKDDDKKENDNNEGDEKDLTNVTLEEFREIVKASCLRLDYFLVASYHRGTLGQTGSGHFSPIAAYHEESDNVLILDVARFKYPPHWTSLSLLYESMSKLDPETKKSRGFVTISQADFTSRTRNSFLSLMPPQSGCWTKPFLEMEDNFLKELKTILINQSSTSTTTTLNKEQLYVDLLTLLEDVKHNTLINCIITSQRLQAPIRACCLTTTESENEEPPFECLNQIPLFRAFNAIVNGPSAVTKTIKCCSTSALSTNEEEASNLTNFTFPNAAWIDKSPPTTTTTTTAATTTSVGVAPACGSGACSAKTCLPEPSISLKKTMTLIIFGRDLVMQLINDSDQNMNQELKHELESLFMLSKETKVNTLNESTDLLSSEATQRIIEEEVEFLRLQHQALVKYSRGCPSYSQECKSCTTSGASSN
mmetsp:Transcript_20640/g.26854  ORF Transcript_20640/g.26854 Transcript_20640/m.26854 type:complete len:545 (-) Transcript_20640:159-1793(-)